MKKLISILLMLALLCTAFSVPVLAADGEIDAELGTGVFVVTQGNNCSAMSTETSSDISWNGTIGVTYTVVYQGRGQSENTFTTTETSISIPVGVDTGYSVSVMAGGQIIASVSVPRMQNGELVIVSGDLNEDGFVTREDAIYLLYSSIFGEDEYPLNQKCDYIKDGVIDRQDAIYLLYHSIFGEEEYPIELSPTAMEVAKDMGIGINLGNTFEGHYTPGGDKYFDWAYVIGRNTPADYERSWGAVITTQECISGMSDLGFNTVRIPVYWGNMMENNGKWIINPDYIARIAEVVDYCEKAGVYSVINIHHFDEFIIRRYSTEECGEIFYTIWKQIAEYFKDYPYTVIFEGYNEAIGGDQYDKCDSTGKLVPQTETSAYNMAKVLNQAFVDAVRSTGGNNAERVLIASGYYTNIDKTTDRRFIMPTDTIEDRLMISVHYVDNAMYWSNQIGTQNWLNYTESQCELLKKAFTDKGIPVFMGETSGGYPQERFGSNAKHKKSSECLEIVLNKLLDYGFVPVIWDTNNDFYSRTEYKINNADNAKVIERIVERINK